MDILFHAPLDIDVQLTGESRREHVDVAPLRPGGARERVPLYDRDETVSGTVYLRPREGRRIEHQGVHVQFMGVVIIDGERSAQEFISYSKELLPAGELRGNELALKFEFRNAEKPYESYAGKWARLRYFVRVTTSRWMAPTTRERDIWVQQYCPDPAPAPQVKIDVGIEDCLHIEFEYNKSQYHLGDIVVGRIYFLLVRLRLKHMELSLVRKESFGAPPNARTDTEQLVKFEIMDGAPVKGETVPFRLFLGGYDLTPTMRDPGCKFTSRNFLSLLLVDEQNRKYYKQTEILLYRRADQTEEKKKQPSVESPTEPKNTTTPHHLENPPAKSAAPRETGTKAPSSVPSDSETVAPNSASPA